MAGGAEGIRGLLSYAVGERAQLPMQPHQPQTEGQPCPNCGKVHAAAPTVAAAQKVGEEAPEVKLPDLEGNTVELADFRGEKTLVLFWNPGCGFCQQMLPDLKEWEAEAPEDAPKLVVVSAGTEEANKEMGLSLPGGPGPELRRRAGLRGFWDALCGAGGCGGQGGFRDSRRSPCGPGACRSRPDDEISLQGPPLLA